MFKHIPNKNLSRGKNDSPANWEKENHRPEKLLNNQPGSQSSNSNVSIPKRYRSVFTENTPLATFGVRREDSNPRSRSPLNHPQAPITQGPLKPVREFLTSPQSQTDQQTEETQRTVHHQMNGYNRAHVETTIQNVDAALARALNKLRPNQNHVQSNQFSVHTGTHRSNSGRANNPFSANGPYANNGFFHLQANINKGPLPAELIARRPTTSTTNLPSPNRQNIVYNSIQIQTASTNALETQKKPDQEKPISMHAPQPIRNVVENERTHPNPSQSTKTKDKDRTDKSEKTTSHKSHRKQTNRKQSPLQNTPRTERQQQPLPEVSVNPHIETPVQQNANQVLTIYENAAQAEIFQNHHHIQVEPTDTIKGTPLILKQKHLPDIQPNIVIQHQRPSLSSLLKPNTPENPMTTQNTDHLNEAYSERFNPSTHLFAIETAQKNPKPQRQNEKNESFMQQNGGDDDDDDTTVTSSSPVTDELDRVLNRISRKNSKTNGTNIHRHHSGNNRPPGRLKNYPDDSDSEMTITGFRDIIRRRVPYPSDAGSDACSDLASEFSETKLRKDPNIRTSTPNLETPPSSSISSKEFGQVRRQLKDLQLMYRDLLKLLDIDMESMRSSAKSNTSSQLDPHNRKYRFRRITPVNSIPQSRIEMREINQRFTHVESSIVTLAESIAKLSGQVQMQRTLKEEVHHLREEVAELRQRLHQNHSPRIISSSGSNVATGSSVNGPILPRMIPPHLQRLVNSNSNNLLNNSQSNTPSPSLTPRANSIIDPRQARKIEQFFGADAMLRYFLSLLNYDEYAPILEKEKIGIYELPYVNERRLQSIGIPYGPCARIIFEAQQYFISLLTLKSNGVDL